MGEGVEDQEMMGGRQGRGKIERWVERGGWRVATGGGRRKNRARMRDGFIFCS